MLFIYPYKTGSESVKKLKGLLEAKIIKLENSKYKYKEGHTLLNWGNSTIPAWMARDAGEKILNHPVSVGIAANKLATLEALAECDVPHVPYTTDVDVAAGWAQDGYKVYARHKLNGHSGDGIEVVAGEITEENNRLASISSELREMGYHTQADIVLEAIEVDAPDMPDAPLYTRGVPNCGEYRVHVFNGEVILYQKKSRRVDEDGEVDIPEDDEQDVRNLETGWVYRTGNLTRLERIERLAIEAIEALGLDFGAVDIIKDHNGDVYVLEINTAPGLGNEETLAAYAGAIKGSAEV